jgi:hypothetical protein
MQIGYTGIGTATASGGVSLDLNTPTGYNAVLLRRGGTTKAYIAVAGNAGEFAPQSQANDLVIRTQGQNLFFSTDSGTSSYAWFDTNGVLSLGAVAGLTNYIVIGNGTTITRSSAGATTTTYGLVSNRIVSVTQTATDYMIGLAASPSKLVASTKTDSGYVMGLDALAFRNQASDAGTLTSLYGIRCLVGHYGTPAGSSGTTSGTQGLYVSTYGGFGAMTNVYGIYIDKSHTITPTNYYPLFVNCGSSDVCYFTGNVSVQSITDRTKYPSSKELAYDALKSLNKKTGKDELDHSQLHEYLRGQECRVYKRKTIKDHNDIDMMVDDLDQPPEIQQTRDIGATLSCVVEVLKDLTDRVDKLEKK